MRRRELKQEALQSMAELVYKIKAMEEEEDVSKVAVDALHKTSGSLQKIIRLLAQATLFWELHLQQECIEHWALKSNSSSTFPSGWLFTA